MGFSFFASFLVLTLFLRLSASQELNSNEFFLSDFFQKMGLNSTPIYNYSAPVCSWKGIICNPQHENVISLQASGLGLSGFIPESTISKLSNLQHLDLSNNNITALSSDFWSWGTTLRSLNLSYNRIDSPLSSNIGNFVRIQTLDLSHNAFSGRLPEAFSSLTSLQFLNLSNNMFEGSIPLGLLHCSALVTVDLSFNQLNGSMPRGFGPALNNLTTLNLAWNGIDGRISDLFGLNHIMYLNLSRNLFWGPAMGVFQLPLQVVDLSQNRFHGHISEVHFNTSFDRANLVYLDMSENQFSGEIFINLNRARSLKHLNLAYNRFSQQKFPSMENMLNIIYLNLSRTDLTGPIPSEISRMSRLVALDLSQNHLVGPVPELRSENLRVLDLSQNNLTGEIPLPLVQKLSEMEKFNFSYNNLSLCDVKFPPKIFEALFFGSQIDCPIAANPDFFRKRETKHGGFKLALAIMLSIFCFFAGMICLTLICRRRTRLWAIKQLSYKEDSTTSGAFSTDSTTWFMDVKVATSIPAIIFNKPLLNCTFVDVLSATSHFDREMMLSDGQFGPIYKGSLPGGIQVAIKVLVHRSTVTDEEAARELECLGRIKHPNLMALMGYCLAGDQRIAIYEYMENGNLENLLHDPRSGAQQTENWSMGTWGENGEDGDGAWNMARFALSTWAFRHKIALGVARALAFLHHGCSPPIIHQCVKASSIYLGPTLEPKLCDFGLAKIFGYSLDDDLSLGSPGYTPPEFVQIETPSVMVKSDVFGFGVVLFELITGKKPFGDDYPGEENSNLVNWVRGLVRKKECSRAVDPRIQGTGSEMQMEEALRIGYLCTADLPSKRPSMQQIVGLLKDIEPAAGQ
ncbi:probable LRR receptor-like serine/threonine-protein kinase At2g24230 [Magnolia sinica]|uniref:probable LRR receptor-like serine/threonine-protein kinase At2g24230 n=1 Tax=Magnolia sinica TaxID=86752 RepID=UPI002659B6B2|nr:probable LRR receptor-like serine/threonine-protein kinase At2g24230 [Magnolia sinica]